MIQGREGLLAPAAPCLSAQLSELYTVPPNDFGFASCASQTVLHLNGDLGIGEITRLGSQNAASAFRVGRRAN